MDCSYGASWRTQVLPDEPGEAELMWRLSLPEFSSYDAPDVLAPLPEAVSTIRRRDSADQVACGLRHQPNIQAASLNESVDTRFVGSGYTNTASMQLATAPTLESCVSSDSTEGSVSLEELKQRKTLQNREHQRRFRLRRKVGSRFRIA